jgi:hypothetical protein
MRASAWFAPFFSTKYSLKIKHLHRFFDAGARLLVPAGHDAVVVEFLPWIKDERACA